MAYTYDDFVKAANSAGKLSRFGQADLEAVKKTPEYGLSMLGFMKDEEEADNDEARMLAGAAMEQLRKNYGVAAPSAADYDDKQNTGLLEDDGAAGAFRYDPDKDPNMAAYRKAYLREGERATANALAQASAATGGVPSSHAVTAATQAGNYYAAQLADKVPELRAQAYQEYLDREALNQRDLENKRTADQQAYQNAMSLWSSLGYATPEIAQILGVAEGTKHSTAAQQELENQRYDNQQAEAKSQQEYENALAMWGYLGYATPEIAKILGVKEGARPAGEETAGGTVDPYAVAKNQQEMYDTLSKSLETGFNAETANSWISDIDAKVKQGMLTEHQAALLKYEIEAKMAPVREANYKTLMTQITTGYSAYKVNAWTDDILAKFEKGLLTEDQAEMLLKEIELRGRTTQPPEPGGTTGEGAVNSQVPNWRYNGVLTDVRASLGMRE